MVSIKSRIFVTSAGSLLALIAAMILCSATRARASTFADIPDSPPAGGTCPVDIGDSLWRDPSQQVSAISTASFVDNGDGSWRAPPTPPNATVTTPPVDIGDSVFRDPSVASAGAVGGGSGDTTLRSTLFTRDGSASSAGTVASASLTESAKGAKAGTLVTANVTCPAGQELRGGGASVQTSDGESPSRAALSQSYASSTTTWTVVGVVSGDNLSAAQALDVTAIALCGQ